MFLCLTSCSFTGEATYEILMNHLSILYREQKSKWYFTFKYIYISGKALIHRLSAGFLIYSAEKWIKSISDFHFHFQLQYLYGYWGLCNSQGHSLTLICVSDSRRPPVFPDACPSWTRTRHRRRERYDLYCVMKRLYHRIDQDRNNCTYVQLQLCAQLQGSHLETLLS